jgi:hypothetical protein
MAPAKQGYHQSLVTLSDQDTEYVRAESGRLYGGRKGVQQRFWAKMIEVYKAHSGEIKPE